MCSSAAGSIAKRCSSDPPFDSSGSKKPFTVRPKRVTVTGLAPPGAGVLWHWTQERPLKIGPSPSSGVSTLVNSSRPALKAASSSSVSPASGAPKPGLLAAGATSGGWNRGPVTGPGNTCATTTPETASTPTRILSFIVGSESCDTVLTVGAQVGAKREKVWREAEGGGRRAEG